jgi:hypothetical protein
MKKGQECTYFIGLLFPLFMSIVTRKVGASARRAHVANLFTYIASFLSIKEGMR